MNNFPSFSWTRVWHTRRVGDVASITVRQPDRSSVSSPLKPDIAHELIPLFRAAIVGLKRKVEEVWEYYVLLFISRYGDDVAFIIHFFSTELWHGVRSWRETMIYSIYSKSPFGYLLSIIYGSHLFSARPLLPYFVPYRPPPSLTCRNKRHKILEHEPNISLPLCLSPLSIQEKIKQKFICKIVQMSIFMHF